VALAVRPARALATDGRPAIAVTIDDFRIDDGPLLDGAAKHARILATLARFKVRAAGFVAAANVDDATGRRHLAAWVERGHLVGNHTYSHRDLADTVPAEAIADVLRAERVVGDWPTYVRRFRFPYLSEGRTREVRDALRAGLAAHGYANGHVTVDTSDWYVAQRLVARLAKTPDADLAPWRRFYVGHVLDRAAFYDRLARDVLGRSLPHTLLVHHNLTSALFLGDALDALVAADWRVIDADVAFADPAFAAQPDIVPAGQSLLWQLARERGGFEERLRTPGEDGEYERAAMDRLGL
jgi:peptidoglycan/xylan/chitin deacetylase (PgdA/CDA1 family)